MAKEPQASSEASTFCRICGRKLSQYNKTGKCFHHKPDELLPEEKPEKSPPEQKDSSDVGMLITLVAEAYAVTLRDIQNHDRRGKFVLARHVSAYLMSEELKLSYSQIEKKLEIRNPHYAINTISKKLKDPSQKELREMVQSIRTKFKAATTPSGT